MQYRKDKKSDNELSALGMGVMRLPATLGKVDLQKADEVIMAAINSGINYFDTAYIYPGSEVALGHVLDKNKAREKVYIATKLPVFLCQKREDFDKYFNTQLERLKTDYIDYYMLHMLCNQADFDRLRDLGVLQWAEEKRQQGKIKQFGFSFHGASGDFVSIVDSYDWHFCMIQYNYVNINYQAGQSGLKHAHGKGLSVFIMEPLLGGRLANALPEKAVKLMKESNAAATPASWALRWLWNQPEVTLVLSGMNQVEQITENVTLATQTETNSMTAAELAVIDQVIQVFAESYKIPCTGCNYCLPCPVNINIPGAFAGYNSSFAMGRMVGMGQYVQSMSGTSASPSSVTKCVRCGKCEKHCPQNIKIMDRLVDVRKRMEPGLFRLGMAVFRKIVHRKRKKE
ncbi:MAG: aldo/keto reductase [Defluviitaleaceae bacterium]|nr:aldo/keto reductase [Defluviitaleaceae bacterium]